MIQYYLNAFYAIWKILKEQGVNIDDLLRNGKPDNSGCYVRIKLHELISRYKAYLYLPFYAHYDLLKSQFLIIYDVYYRRLGKGDNVFPEFYLTWKFYICVKRPILELIKTLEPIFIEMDK